MKKQRNLNYKDASPLGILFQIPGLGIGVNDDGFTDGDEDGIGIGDDDA